MTPSGVEHFETTFVLAGVLTVNRSMTPSGVEHFSSGRLCGLFRMSEPFYDAIRR